jgi:hypothetical protein
MLVRRTVARSDAFSCSVGSSAEIIELRASNGGSGET